MHQIQNTGGAYSAPPDPLAGLRGGRFAAGEGRGGEALDVEPSHFSTGSDATEHGQTEISVDYVRCHEWLTS